MPPKTRRQSKMENAKRTGETGSEDSSFHSLPREEGKNAGGKVKPTIGGGGGGSQVISMDGNGGRVGPSGLGQSAAGLALQREWVEYERRQEHLDRKKLPWTVICEIILS
jgi:hypothetical protein